MNIFARIFKRTPKPLATRGYTGVAGFEAGGGGRRFRGSGSVPNLQSAMLASREAVGRRTRAAVCNNGIATGAEATWVGEAIGSGADVIPQTGDDALDAIIKGAFYSWADRADYFGSSSFYTMQATFARRFFTDGETFALLVIDGDELKIKMLDPAQIPPLTMELQGGGCVVAGVELNAGGRRVAYHLYKNWLPSLPLLRGLEVTGSTQPTSFICSGRMRLDRCAVSHNSPLCCFVCKNTTNMSTRSSCGRKSARCSRASSSTAATEHCSMNVHI